jgi:ATP-dependent RNA helicase DHX29
MSATVDAGRFSKYLGDAPVMNVPGRTFPVRTYYLEDAIELVRFTADENARKPLNKTKWEDDDIEDTDDKDPVGNTGGLLNYSKETRGTLSRMDTRHINYELIVRLIEHVAYSPEFVDYSQAILVFLPGMGEIRRLNDMLMGHPKFRSNEDNGGWLIYPLHSTVASEDQEAAFSLPPSGVRKIVIATNIAETGITIPDVTCVIDSGKHKEMRFDEKRQLSRLVETFISRANAKQRRGRAGRVQEGLCFHLFTKDQHDNWVYIFFVYLWGLEGSF